MLDKSARAARLDEEIAYYRVALDLRPDCPDSCHNLGTALAQRGRLKEAVRCFDKALSLKPDRADTHTNLGTALQQLGLLDEAVTCYRMALDLDPASPELHNNLGSVLGKQGRFDQEIVCYRTALDLKPDYPEALYNLGVVLAKQGFRDEAIVCYRRAIDLRPRYASAHNNLGVELQRQDRLDEAVECYFRAIDLNSGLADAHNNLGSAFRQSGRLDKAVASFRDAIELKPDDPEGHANLGMALLARGEMAEGWLEYEWRWKTRQMIGGGRDFVQPQWRGEAAAGRTLLVHAEQGFGDTLQFCRFAVEAAASGLHVIVEAPKPLVRLLRSLPLVDSVVERGLKLPAFDLQCPMLSLPLALRNTATAIPGAASYLHADEKQSATWRTRLAALENRCPRVGLVWAGAARENPDDAACDRRRSLSPDRLAPLFAVTGLHFFSLQIGGPIVPKGLRITDVMDEIGDFADTAALIANLDLVIAVDSAVAHLGAALGKPVWMLDRFDPCWRWLTNRRDTPWYPTLRIYRQPRPGDWEAVLAEVARDLSDFAELRRHG
jgi:tetratricopeptide (TPR) repeat protein